MAIPATDQRCHNCKYVRLLHTDAPCYRCSHNAVSLWEPQPAPEPAKPMPPPVPAKCAKCGRQTGYRTEYYAPGYLCSECKAEAARVAKLRARIVELLKKNNVPVKAYADGNAGLCIGVEDDNAVVEAAGMPGRFRWTLRTLIILVPEGESNE